MKPRGPRGVDPRMPDQDCLPLRLDPWLARHDLPAEEAAEEPEPDAEDATPTG